MTYPLYVCLFDNMTHTNLMTFSIEKKKEIMNKSINFAVYINLT